jgi:hypothetical protein
MLVGMAFVPLVTSVVVAILLQRVQHRGQAATVIEQADRQRESGGVPQTDG